jgi:hypothetical protein
VLNQAINAAAARAAAQTGAKLGEVGFTASGYDFDIAIFGVANPAAQFELAGFAVNKPAKAYSLHTALNQKMENHRDRPVPVLQMSRMCATAASIE